MEFDAKKDLILRRLSALEGRIGFLAVCPAQGLRIALHENEPMRAASVIKLPIMAEAFRRFEDGSLDPAEEVEVRACDKQPSCGALTYLHDGVRVTWKDLVTLMIILSDNTATNLLIDRLTIGAVNGFLRSAGCSAGTDLARRLFEPELAAHGIENHVTAADVVHLLEEMLAGTLVSPAASAEMLRILGDQRLNGKLPFWLHGRGIRIAHKTGEDDGITHDAGILYTPQPWIAAFLSNETNVPVTERTIQDVAAILADVPCGMGESL